MAASAGTVEGMVSMRVTVMAATLVALYVLATNTHAAYTLCCRRYMTGRINFLEIKSFSLQMNSELCPVRAFIFHTNKGKRCVDPCLKWVMDYVRRIQNLAEKMSSPKQHHTHASDYFNLGESCSSVSPKGDQKPKPQPKPQPKQSFTAAPDKMITDGPPPVKLCKW